MTAKLDPQASRLLRVGQGFELSKAHTAATPGFTGGKSDGKEALKNGVPELSMRQELLFANGTTGDERRVLLVLQAMDTAGKGGIVRHVVGSVDPQGVHLAAFKKPTATEKRHDFLWRIRKQLPPAGQLGVFDRSHYEDVLIHRVRQLSSPEVIEERYGQIVDFERELGEQGISVVKVMLNVSYEEQARRLEARLDAPEKHWKFNPSDIDERMLWPAYMEAYQLALTRTSTEAAPWYVVPADRKWYARLAVQQLLLEAFRGLDQSWPPADFDPDEQRARLTAPSASAA